MPSATQGNGKTVAVVVAYHHPKAEQDLRVYRETFGLPPCTTANGCFTQVDEVPDGVKSPATQEWEIETALDLDAVSATCPNCDILLIETGGGLDQLGGGVDLAVSLGADAVSNSYGLQEQDWAPTQELKDLYDHPGVIITAAGGDYGFERQREQWTNEKGECVANCREAPTMPSAFPTVLSAGGTTLDPQGTSGRGWDEKGWSFSGNGCSKYISKPSWQPSTACGKRLTNDVSALAQGFAIYTTEVFPSLSASWRPGWLLMGGSSLSAPLVAGASALWSEERRSEGPAGVYGHPGEWFDTVGGEKTTSKECAPQLCEAIIGYDGPTGVGTPNGGAIATPPSAITEAPSGVTTAKATLHATVNPQTSVTDYYFEYAEIGGKFSKTATTKVAGYTEPKEVTAQVEGLSSGIQYRFRVVAESAGGTTVGALKLFSTPPNVHLADFGVQGANTGDLQDPADVAVDGFDNVWVADAGNDRIQQFTPAGEVMRACGSSGTAPGQFAEPSGIAVNPYDGNIYVSDTGNDRVQVLSPTCDYVRSIGATTLDAPLGLSFEPDGYGVSGYSVFVADSNNNRVREFDWKPGGSAPLVASTVVNGKPTDVALYAAGAAKTEMLVAEPANNRVRKYRHEGSSSAAFTFVSSLEHSFSAPSSVELDATNGLVYVADSGNDKVQQFLRDGTYVTSFGAGGSGAGQFGSMGGIAIDSGGKAYVADAGNDRVAGWLGAVAVFTRPATEVSGTAATLNASIHPRGVSTTYQFEYGTSVAYGSTSPSSPASAGSGSIPKAVSQGVSGLAPGTAYHYRIVATSANGTVRGRDHTFFTPAAPKVSILTPTGVDRRSAVLHGTVRPNGQPTTYWFEYGETTGYGSQAPATAKGVGSGHVEVSVEEGIEGLRPGAIYHARLVASNGSGTSHSADLRFSTKVLPPVSSVNADPTDLHLDQPLGVDTAENGSVWVLNRGNGKLLEFDEEGQFQGSIAPEAQLLEPSDLAIDAEGDFWILDSGNYRLVELDDEGALEDEGVLDYFASDLAISPKGEVWAVAPFAVLVLKTGLGGGTAAEISLPEMVEPMGIDVSADGHLWVADPTAGSIFELDEGGNLIGEIDASAVDPQGSFSPAAVAIAADGTVWTAEFSTGDILQFSSDGDLLSRASGEDAGPHHLAVDPSGAVWATDPEANDLHKWVAQSRPSVSTKAPKVVGGVSARLSGTVNPNGSKTSYQFDYGKTTAYGSSVPVSPKDIGEGTANIEVTEKVEALEEEETYHFRLVAISDAGVTYGADQTFTTRVPVSTFASGQVESPAGIAFDSTGDVWVSDAAAGVVKEFNASGEYLRQLGKGKLSDPGPVAIDSEGDVWVLDGGYEGATGNENYSGYKEFSPSGEYLSGAGEWEYGVAGYSDLEVRGGQIWTVDGTMEGLIHRFDSHGEYLGYQPAFGEGALMTPTALAFDSGGDVWIGDSEQIRQYSPEGEYLSSFQYEIGSEVCQLRGIADLEIDSEGNLWVSDWANDVLQKFTPSGECLGALGESGSGPGQLSYPGPLTISSSGDLWVADLGNARVQIWDVPEPPLPPTAITGESVLAADQAWYQYKATLKGTVNPNGGTADYYFEYGVVDNELPPYQVKFPVTPKEAGSGTTGIAVSETIGGLAEGTKYRYRLVAKKGNRLRYGQEKTFMTPSLPSVSSQTATAISATGATLGGKVTPVSTWTTTTYQFEYGKTTALGTKVPVSPKELGSPSGAQVVSEVLSGLSPGTKYHYRLTASNGFWTATWIAPGSFTTYKALPTYSLAFGSKGTTNGKLEQPHDVAVDSAGNAYVADTANNRIQKFNSKGEYVGQMGSKGSGNGQFNSPKGVAVNSTNIYVADTGNNRIQKFNLSGEYIAQFGSVGSGNGQFNGPTGLAVGSDIYVADTGNNRIQRFTQSGAYVGKFGSVGSGNGQLSAPADVAIVSGGFYVADTGNNRIQKFNGSGGYLSQIGSKGTGDGQFEGPTAVDVDSQDALFVLDSGNRRIQKFSSEHGFLGKFGSKGTGAGQFEGPAGLDVDAEDHVWATDKTLHRVLKW